MTVSALRYAGREFVRTLGRDEAEREAGVPGLLTLLAIPTVTLGILAALTLTGCSPRVVPSNSGRVTSVTPQKIFDQNVSIVDTLNGSSYSFTHSIGSQTKLYTEYTREGDVIRKREVPLGWHP